MIRDCLNMVVVRPSMLRVHVLTLNLALDAHVYETHSHDHSRNQRSTVLGLS
jgi:hypothetical protein